MTLQQIAERLERIERLWAAESNAPQVREIERLRLEIERHILHVSATA